MANEEKSNRTSDCRSDEFRHFFFFRQVEEEKRKRELEEPGVFGTGLVNKIMEEIRVKLKEANNGPI